MKKIALFVIVLLSNFSHAQHCRYHFSDILVLKVHTRESQNTIPNLKITLVKKKNDKNANGTVYILSQYNKFPFLSDEYSCIVPSNLDIEQYYLKIESVCEFGTNGWTYYGTKETTLTKNNKFSLCGNADSDDFFTSDGDRIYKPIEIVLRNRSCETR